MIGPFSASLQRLRRATGIGLPASNFSHEFDIYDHVHHGLGGHLDPVHSRSHTLARSQEPGKAVHGGD